MKSGKKEDAFDIYFCYLEMFVDDYEKNQKMIEMLSEFETNGGRILMKHRDHYSHSVYVFALGLAIYETNTIYREIYKKHYKLSDEHEAACHYLQYWGLASLFHDIGYPFELPFEQVASYFEESGEKRENRPFMAYKAMESFIAINDNGKKSINSIAGNMKYHTTNDLFAHVLADRLGNDYGFTESQMFTWLEEKPTKPDGFNYYMDHAYFSAVILFRKLFGEKDCKVNAGHLDALTAILMHNSLFKFSINNGGKEKKKKPLKAELHPLAYMLMLCDELQCWDRTAYGRNSKKELYPMKCVFDFSDDRISVVYLFDKKECAKIDSFKDEYIIWMQNPQGKDAPSLKEYSKMYIRKEGISKFQEDIMELVDLSEIKLNVEIGLTKRVNSLANKSYLSDSSFISLYKFAMILNKRWDDAAAWKAAKNIGQEEKFLKDKEMSKEVAESFKRLSLEYKLSNINQAKAFAKYLNEIGCFYTDREVDFELLESFGREELAKIGVFEHQRWLQEHYDMGWIYGTPKETEREFLRQHKDMIPGLSESPGEVPEEAAKANYRRLDKEEQDKDTDPMECMLAMLRMFDGIRIYRLNQ